MICTAKVVLFGPYLYPGHVVTNVGIVTGFEDHFGISHPVDVVDGEVEEEGLVLVGYDDFPLGKQIIIWNTIYGSAYLLCMQLQS